MSEEIENPQAFPIGKTLYYEKGVACTHEGHDGMDLRDYMAGQALVGMHANQYTYNWKEEVKAKRAYESADAMLKARQL